MLEGKQRFFKSACIYVYVSVFIYHDLHKIGSQFRYFFEYMVYITELSPTHVMVRLNKTTKITHIYIQNQADQNKESINVRLQHVINRIIIRHYDTWWVLNRLG